MTIRGNASGAACALWVADATWARCSSAGRADGAGRRGAARGAGGAAFGRAHAGQRTEHHAEELYVGVVPEAPADLETISSAVLEAIRQPGL